MSGRTEENSICLIPINRPRRSNDSSFYPLLWHGTIAPRRGKAIHSRKGNLMFLILAVVLVLLWLGGFFVLHVSSFLIHLLLIFALVSIIMNFVGGRRAV